MGVYVARTPPPPPSLTIPTTEEDEWQVELQLLGKRIAEVLRGIAVGFDKRTPGWGAVGADIVCPHYDRARADRRVSAQYLNMDIHFCDHCLKALKTTLPELTPRLLPPPSEGLVLDPLWYSTVMRTTDG